MKCRDRQPQDPEETLLLKKDKFFAVNSLRENNDWIFTQYGRISVLSDLF